MTVQQLKFYASAEHSCGYLPHRSSVSLFADPDAQLNPNIYSVLIDHGFRRSGEHVYRPYCPGCDECIPLRIPLARFEPNRNQKRTLKRNQDLRLNVSSALTTEHFELYQRYISSRHAGGAMDKTDEIQFRQFLTSDWCNTVFIETYLQDKLIAVAVTDIVQQGWSAFYTFFDPELSHDRSLGRYAILRQVELARAAQSEYLYLGYWIKDCAKMNYKSEYQPLEQFQGERWIDF
ncbi:MAG: arginyltransferase [Gammaproteobacteria bacterium]|nr:arginyltransferase [Gammaproteobacteria bacterium]